MLAVKPVAFKDIAREICENCGVPFGEECYTYFAADVNEDATKINHVIGVCTFRMKGNVNRIEYLKEADGIEDEEAMIIMARTVMNFMYRCEVVDVTINEENIPEEFIKKLGFRVTEKGYSINLPDFYKSPCSYTGK